MTLKGKRSRPDGGAGRKQALAPSTGCALAELLVKELPGIAVQEKFGNKSFSMDGKVFGFTRGDEAVVLKLPADRVLELMEERGAQQLVMGKRVMREWVVVERGVRGWRGELRLVREAVAFVCG